VPDAGFYDGVLGVVLGAALIESLNRKRLPFAIELVGFSEEEGVRFGVPFLGSCALVGRLDEEMLSRRDNDGITVRAAIEQFGLNPAELHQARLDGGILGYVEFHIEQGPVLEKLGLPLGVVETVAGQSKLQLSFLGCANHAGTTPMCLRHDALAGAAEWIIAVEQHGRRVPGLVATVGTIDARPGATNVIAGEVRLTVDVRHGRDEIRIATVETLIQRAEQIATRRGLLVRQQTLAQQATVPMNARLVSLADEAVRRTGSQPHRMISGAGHDAMILAEHLPCVMIFLRTPGGISHSPEERVNPTDVEKALEAGVNLLELLAFTVTLENKETPHA
jgi:allantoate deiminase